MQNQIDKLTKITIGRFLSLQLGRNEDDFATAMNNRGIALLSDVQRVKSVSLGRDTENPDKFMLLVLGSLNG